MNLLLILYSFQVNLQESVKNIYTYKGYLNLSQYFSNLLHVLKVILLDCCNMLSQNIFSMI